MSIKNNITWLKFLVKMSEKLKKERENDRK